MSSALTADWLSPCAITLCRASCSACSGTSSAAPRCSSATARRCALCIRVGVASGGVASSCGYRAGALPAGMPSGHAASALHCRPAARPHPPLAFTPRQVAAWLWSAIWFVGGVPGAYILWWVAFAYAGCICVCWVLGSCWGLGACAGSSCLGSLHSRAKRGTTHLRHLRHLSQVPR